MLAAPEVENDDDVAGDGVVYLAYGPFAGVVPLASAGARFAAEEGSDAGQFCAGSGDLTGDGKPDFVVTVQAESDWVTGSLFLVPGHGI